MSEQADAADSAGLDPAEQRRAVRERYGRIAAESDADPGSGSCCGDSAETATSQDASQAKGYTAADLAAAPDGANLDLGCGNPAAFAEMEPGETVLDLGSGAGFDCFIAAREVGPAGQVVGVDMTPAMVENARDSARDNDVDNVDFRLGEIEHLPVADETVDVVISNCVVNLSPDKRQVFDEAFRALRPGGRLAISDVVMTAELPVEHRAAPDSVAACIAGASPVPNLEAMLADAGFVNVSVEPKADSAEFISEWDEERDLSDYVVSATIEGRKPAE